MTKKKEPVTYFKIRDIINRVFVFGPAYNMNNITQGLKQPLDWKSIPCGQNCISHKGVKDYLKCCTHDFTIFDGNEPIILSKHPFFESLAYKRINDHIKNKKYPPNFKHLHFELLVVNIFNVKTTISPEVLEKVFEFVYGIRLDNLFGYYSLSDGYNGFDYKKYIEEIKSVNLRFNGPKTKITIVPVNDKLYKYSNNKDLFKFIKRPKNLEKNVKPNISLDRLNISLTSKENSKQNIQDINIENKSKSLIEKNVVHSVNLNVEDNKENIAKKQEYERKIGHIKTFVDDKDIFGNQSGSERKKKVKMAILDKNLKIVELNIPKSLIKNKLNPSRIFDMFNGEEGLDEGYFYVTEALWRK